MALFDGFRGYFWQPTGAENPPFRNRLVGAKTSPLEFSRDLVDNFRLFEKNPISDGEWAASSQ